MLQLPYPIIPCNMSKATITKILSFLYYSFSIYLSLSLLLFFIVFNFFSPSSKSFFITSKNFFTISNSYISISKSFIIFSFQTFATPLCIYINIHCIYSFTINLLILIFKYNLHTATNSSTSLAFLSNKDSVTISPWNL